MCILYTIVSGRYEYVEAEAEHLLNEGHRLHKVPKFSEKFYGEDNSSVLTARMVMKKELSVNEPPLGSLINVEKFSPEVETFVVFDKSNT